MSPTHPYPTMICSSREWRSIRAQESIRFTPLEVAVRDGQDPRQIDKLSKIQQDIDETKIIVVSSRGLGHSQV